MNLKMLLDTLDSDTQFRLYDCCDGLLFQGIQCDLNSCWWDCKIDHLGVSVGYDGDFELVIKLFPFD